MKIAISSDSGMVSAHFGRAPEFTFVTIENNKAIKKEVFPNPGHSIGSLPEFVKEHGAEYIISSGMGPRAIDFFHKFGIKVITGASGDIDSVVNTFIEGNLTSKESPFQPGEGKGYGFDKIHTEADDEHEHHHS